MRITSLLIFICAFTISSRADMGVSYCMKAMIKMKDGRVHKGYFMLGSYDLRVEKDKTGWHYVRDGKDFRLQSKTSDPLTISKTEKHFHQFVWEQMMESTRLYASLVLMRSGDVYPNTSDRIPVATNAGVELIKTDIANLVVEELYYTMPGTLSESKCAKQDVSWLTRKVSKSENLGYATLCDYTAVLFESKTPQVNELLERLKTFYSQQAKLAEGSESASQEDYDQLQKQISETIEILRTLRVLVLSSCSC